MKSNSAVLDRFDSQELAVHTRLRNDPVQFCKHACLDFTPHRGQVELLRSDLHRQKTLVVAGRRLGKTYGMVHKVAYDLFRFPGIRIFIFNPSETQSDILFDRVVSLFRHSPYLSRFAPSKLTGKKLSVHAEPNQSVLQVLKVGIDASKVRGHGTDFGYFIGDEILAHFDAWEITNVIEPMILEGKGGNAGLVYLSSPGEASEDNFFYATYKDWQEQERIALSENRRPRHRVITFTYEDVDHIDHNEVADQKRKYEKRGQLWFFEREYLGKFNRSEGHFFCAPDIRQCVNHSLPKGGRLDTYVWSMDPGGRRSPAVIQVARLNQSLSRLEVTAVRSFVFADVKKENDGHEVIDAYEELVNVCVDLRKSYSPVAFYVDPQCEKSLTERLRNTFQFPIVDTLIGSYPSKMTFLRDLQRALKETKIVWNDPRITEQLLRFAPPFNQRTQRYEFDDRDYDFIVTLGMLYRYLGDRESMPYVVSVATRSRGELW